MTNEKAIQLLHRLSDEQFDGIHGDERREALSMAVRALSGEGDLISRKAVMKEFSDFVRESNNSDFAPTPTWNDAVSLVGSMPSAQPQACDDAISRDDAIMAVKTGALSAATLFGRTDEGATAYYETVKAIKALPSAQPHWIPCSERLPKEKDAGILKKLGTKKRSEYVLATVEVKGERMTVTACTYDGKWDWNMKYAFPDFKVLAWMPLSEPYGGDAE